MTKSKGEGQPFRPNERQKAFLKKSGVGPRGYGSKPTGKGRKSAGKGPKPGGKAKPIPYYKNAGKVRFKNGRYTRVRPNPELIQARADLAANLDKMIKAKAEIEGVSYPEAVQIMARENPEYFRGQKAGEGETETPGVAKAVIVA